MARRRDEHSMFDFSYVKGTDEGGLNGAFEGTNHGWRRDDGSS